MFVVGWTRSGGRWNLVSSGW